MTQRPFRGPGDPSSGEAPMEQVREILFGAQLKDIETRFQRQEERLLREIREVKDSLRKRFDSLENFMKSEVSALLARLREESNEREASLKAEQRERADLLSAEQRERAEALSAEKRERVEGFNQLTNDLLAASDAFERRLAKLSGTLDSAERELRELVLTENGRLTDKIEAKYGDALSVLAKTASQIRADMVYRTALTSMFTETVLGLSRPWSLQAEPEDGEVRGEDFHPERQSSAQAAEPPANGGGDSLEGAGFRPDGPMTVSSWSEEDQREAGGLGNPEQPN